VIGTVTRVSAAGVFVKVPSILPGIELGPLPSIVHRYKDDSPGLTEHFTTYKAGDTVHVVEDSPNDFIVTGIVK
jgi:hypothetical protein